MKTFALIFSGIIVFVVVWHIIYTNSKKEPKKEPTPAPGSEPKPKVVPRSIVGVTIPDENPDEYLATARVILTDVASSKPKYLKNKALETLYADYLTTALKPSKTYNEWFVWKFGKDNKNPLLSMYQEYVSLTPAPYKKYEEWFSGLFGNTNRDTGDYCQTNDGVDGKWQGTGGNSGYCRVNVAS